MGYPRESFRSKNVRPSRKELKNTPCFRIVRNSVASIKSSVKRQQTVRVKLNTLLWWKICKTSCNGNFLHKSLKSILSSGKRFVNVAATGTLTGTFSQESFILILRLNKSEKWKGILCSCRRFASVAATGHLVLYIYLDGEFIYLFIYLFVRDKLQDGWTNLNQTFCGDSDYPRIEFRRKIFRFQSKRSEKSPFPLRSEIRSPSLCVTEASQF